MKSELRYILNLYLAYIYCIDNYMIQNVKTITLYSIFCLIKNKNKRYCSKRKLQSSNTFLPFFFWKSLSHILICLSNSSATMCFVFTVCFMGSFLTFLKQWGLWTVATLEVGLWGTTLHKKLCIFWNTDSVCKYIHTHIHIRTYSIFINIH